jgi:hypothetical protein
MKFEITGVDFVAFGSTDSWGKSNQFYIFYENQITLYLIIFYSPAFNSVISRYQFVLGLEIVSTIGVRPN